MLVTVAICTWNRSKLLDRTLDRMRSLRIPAGVEWELLVVNNNCTDDTDAVFARYQAAGELPLRRLFEPNQGHCNARNCAVAQARGELLLWTDDDVIVDPSWLEAYVEAAAKYPAASFFGGRIEPDFETEPPDWLSEELELFRGPLAILNLGPELRLLGAEECPFGASMGFRASAYRDRFYNTQLGRVGSQLFSGDDTAYCEALAREGFSGAWVGTAVVHHHVPAARMTWEYMERWFAGCAASYVRGERPPGPYWLGVPRYMWRRKAEVAARRLINTCLLRRTPARLRIEAVKLNSAIRELRGSGKSAPKSYSGRPPAEFVRTS